MVDLEKCKGVGSQMSIIGPVDYQKKKKKMRFLMIHDFIILIRAVVGQRSLSELSFANKTKMFFRAKKWK